MSLHSGRLWVVATPLGNPGDLSARARETLASVDGILAEDTRRAGMLLSRCGISPTAFTSFHEHNEEARLPHVIARLQEGAQLALVSDAGTPLLSDPGYRLVRACREAAIPVSPLPGPSAPTAALSASGLPPYPFVFLGFLPRGEADRATALRPYAGLAATLVFFERGNRLAACLRTAFRILGAREACIARELTKIHEEFILFPLAEHEALIREWLGEITVLVGPPGDGERTRDDELERIIAEESAAGGKPRELARRIQARTRGWSGKELYARLRLAAG
jgi:16S rRNA (cytidine1402-2'-O)-methyltransferase